MKSCISNIFFYNYGGARLTLFIWLRDKNVKSYGECELSP